MNGYRQRWPLLLMALLTGAALLTASCGKDPRSARGALDTPEHHTLRGHDAIDAGKWDDAGRSFDHALSLKPDHAPALAGKAIVVAHGADRPDISDDQREEIFDRADDLIDDAEGKAKAPEDVRAVHVAAIRVHRLTKMPADDWLEEAADHYADAIETEDSRDDPLPAFYMARAYRDAFQLQDASDLYQRVLALNRGKTREADQELATLQKVIRARPGTRHGQVIAFMERVNRADIAALFIEELRLAQLYTRGGANVDNSFQASGQDDFQADQVVQAPAATDINDHPLRSDIEEVMEIGVVGLEPDPAHKFNPDVPVSRAEFALMVEDILVKVTAEQGLRTRFIGQVSPFPDVRNDLPYFNAVQVVVTRNLMEPAEPVRGMFKPLDPVSGADALLVIRQLRDELQSYLRS